MKPAEDKMMREEWDLNPDSNWRPEVTEVTKAKEDPMAECVTINIYVLMQYKEQFSSRFH